MEGIPYEVEVDVHQENPLRDGIRNKRRGEVFKHPLIRNVRKEDDDLHEAAMMFGLGFAECLKVQRDVIRSSQVAVTSNRMPSNIGVELATGGLDRVEIGDMFEPNGQKPRFHVDVDAFHQRRLGLSEDV
jgi:hypothetical protein